MKTKIILFCLLIGAGFGAKTQTYVTIPDANFVAWLNTNYSSCMNGNQMDITCSDITNAISVDITAQSIHDLTGIEYFTSLYVLTCTHNLLTSLPTLPANLQTLNCDGNQQLTSLPTLPANLQDLNCGICPLTSLPTLPANLQDLNCGSCSLTSLPTLPANLQTLNCTSNQLTSLPTLPNSLQQLKCGYNQLTTLPVLPNSLQTLWCQWNLLTALPTVPNSLQSLICLNNELTTLPTLPNSLQDLGCGNNPLTTFPTTLPDSLHYLACFNNQLTNLPALPSLLNTLWCSNNQLTTLPALPDSLRYLYCNHNQLMFLPTLPDSLYELYCPNNQLTTLPSLPGGALYSLCCDSNNISCFPIFPAMLTDTFWFSIAENPFTCLPNYVPAMDSATLTYPLCVDGDVVNNPSGCIGAEGILGHTYTDNNTNCVMDAGDQSLVNIPVKLYDNSNNLLVQTYSFSNGVYYFPATAGTYTVKIDTAGMSFTVQCFPGVDTTVTLTIANPLANDVNFALVCKPGFDVGVQSVLTSGRVFPGQEHTLSVVAGDMSQWWYNLIHCAAGVSGQVEITVTGPVIYVGPAPGALSPTVSGNIFTYTIADFGNVNNALDFSLFFLTDTTAQAGDWISIYVAVTPVNGDNNVSNNTYSFRYRVANSYDPNMKEVSPVDVLFGYQDWVTYTIHFQNTGTAPAFNIRLADTLDNKLDLASFQVINYSHYNTVSLNGNMLVFYFPNIMLPDSTSDEPGSKGFVQYRIKPKANLPLGTQIENTAYIWFDYNTPIITNTTVNNVTLSIKENEAAVNLSVYPNPFSEKTMIMFILPENNHVKLNVCDLSGKIVQTLYNGNVNKNQEYMVEFDGRALPAGIFIYKMIANENVYTGKMMLIKE